MAAESWRMLGALAAAVALTVAATARESRQPSPPGAQTVLTVISVAGFSWDRFSPLARAGRMPGLAALTGRGGAAGDILAKGFPTRTSILASLITGRWHFRHGILEPGDLSEPGAPEARIPVWRYLAEAGQPCVVAGFPLVFPREHPGNRVVPPKPGVAVPTALQATVTGGSALAPDLGRTLAESLAADLGVLEAARAAVPAGPPCHLFLHLPGLGRWEDALRDSLPEEGRLPLLEGYYLALDRMLAEALAWRGSVGTLFLVSEDGSRGGRPSQRRDFPVLERYPSFGFLWASGAGIRSGVMPTTVQPPDLTPTLLYVAGLPIPVGQDGRVAFGLLEESANFRHPLRFR